MDKAELKRRYTKVFIRHIKEEGTYDKWLKAFQKHNTFDKTMEICIDYQNKKINPFGNAINKDGLFQIKNLTFCTPYYVMYHFKGFSIEPSIYQNINQETYEYVVNNLQCMLKQELT